jgi:hypothetical protein
MYINFKETLEKTEWSNQDQEWVCYMVFKM